MKNIKEFLKKFFKKFQSYSFWVSLSAAIVLLVTSLGKAFNFSVENETVENVIMSVAGVLVVLGIVVSPTDENSDDLGTDKNTDESNSQNEEDEASDCENDSNEE